MKEFIESKQLDLARLCVKYRVRKLELFGSAASDTYDPDKSDLDFLVEFEELLTGQYADNYFGLLEELESLFQHRIDLVMTSAIDNPYFLKNIEKSRILLYAA